MLQSITGKEVPKIPAVELASIEPWRRLLTAVSFDDIEPWRAEALSDTEMMLSCPDFADVVLNWSQERLDRFNAGQKARS